VRRLLVLVVLASTIVSADVVVKNGGTSLGPVTALNCGANTSCSRSGSVATITATSGGAGGSGAPVDGGYVVLGGLTAGSTNERALSSGNYTAIDTGTSGQVQVDWAHGLTCTAGQALTSSGTTALACTSTLTASDVACAGTCVGDAEIAGVAGSKVTGAVASATTCSAAESADYLNLVCTAGQYVTCSGTACSCTTPSAVTSVSGSTFISSSGGTTPALSLSATGTPSSTTYLRGDNTWATVSGGSGSPGGSSGQVQYNNAGAFAGAANVETDGTHLRLVGTTTHATAGTTPRTTLAAFQHYGSNGPAFLQASESVLDFDTHLGPLAWTRSDDASWGCVVPGASGSATYTVSGQAVAGSATGTAALVAWAATDESTRAPRVQHPAAATVNTSAGLRAGVDYVWRGNAAGLGGWVWAAGFRLNLVTATTRVFAGLKDSTAVLTATADPNAALDAIYFGCNAADANLSICSNDNVGTATCTSLGASFPCHTSGVAYDVALWAPANSTGIRYWIRRLVTGTEASGTVASDLPRNTVRLGWDLNVNTGSTASAVQVHVHGTCWWANP